MKITGLTVHLFEPKPNPLQEFPEYVSTPTRQHGIAVIHTDEGIDGVVTALAQFLRQMVHLWAEARDHIEGQDPFDRGKIEAVLRRRYRWPQLVLGALDIGLWDIAGKALGLPVYKLLGATRDRVLAYGSTVHHTSDERYLEVVRECQEQGFRAVKIHPYCIAEDDIRLCRKVREAVGDDFTLMLDTLGYPGPYTRREVLKVGRVLDELDFWWFEDPLPKTDLDGLAELTASCSVVQVRMGDMVYDMHEYAEMVRRRCMDIIAASGLFGITDSLKLAHLAEANYLGFEPHDFGGGTASLHVLLAVTNANYYELAVPRGWLHDRLYPNLYLDPVWIDSDGYVHGPTTPGLGFEINMDVAKSVTVDTLTA